MRAYVVRRLTLLFPTLIIVSMVVFSLVRFIPGSVIDLIIAEYMGSGQSGETISREEIEHRLGLDKPIWEQYFIWVGGIFRGDLGHSLYDPQYWAQ
jgi:peptide/nickel transport system permease protein